jgi:DNA modification methylase
VTYQRELFPTTRRAYLALADALVFLRGVPDNTFDSCVTDPPYEIFLLGNDWDRTGIAFSVEFWSEVLRVLKPGARLVAFGAPRKYHRLVCAIEDAGFDIDDLYVWLKGGANMPKGGWCSPAIDKHLGRSADREVIGERTLSGTAALSIAERGGTHSIGVSGAGRSKVVPITAAASDEAKRWEGWAWLLKGCHEPICFARKPSDGSGVASLLKWGTGALNVTACAIPRGPGNQSWPPNVALDDEAAEALSAISGETKCASNTNPTKQAGRAFHGNGKPRVWAAEALNKGDTGTAERYFPKFNYVRKANKTEKGDGCPVASVKPEPLIEWLLKLVTPPGGKALEPFAGSGTALVCGPRVGVNVYGIELKPEHHAFALARSGAEEWRSIAQEILSGDSCL